MLRKLSAQTIVAQAGIGQSAAHQDVVAPLHLSTNYLWDNSNEKPAFDYSRTTNPTRSLLEKTLCELEGADQAILTASGMAAVDLTLSLLTPNDLILAPHDCYGGTHRIIRARMERGHFNAQFMDYTAPSAVDEVRKTNPRLVLIETPSNPLLRITDIRKITKAAKAVGALTIADNTLASPALQNPIDLGCDIVVHSTTKFINGHSDVIGGAVLCKNTAQAEELAWWANATGVTGSAFDSYMTLRGLRTLNVRVQQQSASAGALVNDLVGHPAIEKIHYPGLETHPGHDIASVQQRAFGSLFSIEFSPTIPVAAISDRLALFSPAQSLGGFESLVSCPATMTHVGMPPAARNAAGIGDHLLRFSVGLDHPDDLLADILQALERA
ncbi:MAG: trans-sulfuration enzyme family protein [Parvularcula sp.]